MEKKKLSTEEILKAARAQAGKSEPAAAQEGGAQESAPAAEAAAPAEAAEKPAAKPAAPKVGGAPKSTADILAAARAQATAGASGAAKPAAAAAAKPAGAKPAGGAKSTADILAAARAQAGGAASAGAEAPAKPTAKAKAAVKTDEKPAGDRPSVQDMLKAVREGKPAAVVVEDAGKPQLSARPQKPPVASKPRAPEPARRSIVMAILLAPVALFTNAFAAAWTLFTASVAAFSLALARFMMPNVLVEPPSKFKIGPPSDYPLGTASTKWTAQFGIWVVHVMYNGRNEIYALSTVCTHLGCTPNWLEGEQKFKCPCHGSGFYITGINFEGPAPRPLERFGIRVSEDGMLEVDKSVKFQQEMGQWSDSASFVPVA